MTAKQALVAGVMNRKGYSCPEEEQDMVRYDSYAELAEEIKRSIFNVPAAAGISVPQSEKVCPWCGDKIIPNADGTCPKCGGPMD